MIEVIRNVARALPRARTLGAYTRGIIEIRERDGPWALAISPPRPAPRLDPSSPFRRPTKADEKLASYIQASAVKRASAASATASDAMTRTAALRAPRRTSTRTRTELMTLMNSPQESRNYWRS